MTEIKYRYQIVEVPQAAVTQALGSLVRDGWELVSHTVYRGESGGRVLPGAKVLLYSLIFRRETSEAEIEEIRKAMEAAAQKGDDVPPPMYPKKEPPAGGPKLVT